MSRVGVTVDANVEYEAALAKLSAWLTDHENDQGDADVVTELVNALVRATARCAAEYTLSLLAEGMRGAS